MLKNASFSFYLSPRFYYAGLGIAALFAASFFWSPFFTLAFFLLLLLLILLLVDALLLYSKKKGISGHRVMPGRLSNGNENEIRITLLNNYSFPVSLQVIDELPYQLQQRNWLRKMQLNSFEDAKLDYTVTPKERGIYRFGFINVYASSPLRLVQRRYKLGKSKEVKVYPSFIQMKRYQLMAMSNKLTEAGSKKIRRLGHSMEFEQIKEYVAGDDYRTVNWKATARHGNLMVNSYTDERSQSVYCLVCKSRMMKMPFEGLTLLDYAINASVVLLNTAIVKGDRAGLITFAEEVDTFAAADNKAPQMNQLMEDLYAQQTQFLESNWEALYAVVRQRITQRSLLVLFTNFETVESLQRNLPFLKRLAHYHLLMVVFFENTELQEVAENSARTTEEIYIKTIAKKYRLEKKLMVKELQKNGIVVLLTTPKNLTINTLNKYLELKNRQSI